MQSDIDTGAKGDKWIKDTEILFFFSLSIRNNYCLLWEMLEVKGFQPSDQGRSSEWIACVTCSTQQITASIREENMYLTALY